MVLLRCVDVREAEQMLVEVHEGSFGTHANRHAMARKILRAGYYWLTMENDCCIHVRKCHKCQAFTGNVNAPPIPLNVLAAPWSFSMWGIDVIGVIKPKASNGHRFILVAIDYYTKWAEAASNASVTRSVVIRFIKKEIIYRYRLPRKIITCHTLISSGDDHLQTFGFSPAELSCLTPITAQSVGFRDVLEGNGQETQDRGKMVHFWATPHVFLPWKTHL